MIFPFDEGKDEIIKLSKRDFDRVLQLLTDHFETMYS